MGQGGRLASFATSTGGRCHRTQALPGGPSLPEESEPIQPSSDPGAIRVKKRPAGSSVVHWNACF
jgi:hypothetical protein